MTAAGIVAGGNGSRMGGEMPKQFLELDGKPVVIYTAERFLSCSAIDIVIIGINPVWRDYMNELAEKYFPDNDRLIVVDGGADRNETIFNIISAAEKIRVLSDNQDDEDIILTHDAVRPFVTEKMMLDSINAMKDCEICTAAIPATDTIISTESGENADEFPDRNKMRLVQTPQTFKIKTFKKVYAALSETERAAATDVCRLYHSLGYDVRIVDGNVANIKLTYPQDYELAKLIVKMTK